MEKDNEGRMTHCFWVDATSRKSYQYFGDVVVFDTTYNTNKYAMIFAPLLGVNHHRQTTLFGCAFLKGETSDDFEWLFKEWLKAMPAGPPKMIITDQDPAMTKAIAIALPNTRHRYFIWHIVSKFSEKIGASNYKEHYEEFKSCIWNSESPVEFKARWGDVLKKANLSTNEWLSGLYNIRDKWVPAYTKHVFAAHMTSSQRAEISHSFFKGYVSSENSLWDFVTRFKRALSRLRHNELDLDNKDLNEKPSLKTMWVMEETMREVYTLAIFLVFQEELHQNSAYVVTPKDENEHRRLYNVQRVKCSSSRAREIVVDKASNNVSCSCKNFKFDGISCRHMLAYFTREQILELHNKYILRRWTKSAKAIRVRDDLGGGVKDICDPYLLGRRKSLFQLATNLIDDAALTKDGTKLLRETFESAREKLCDLKNGSEDGEGSVIQVNVPPQHGFKEPLQVRAKGCGKRLKRGKEKAVNNGRFCHGCHKPGQTHDKRNCPNPQEPGDTAGP